jgi:hypothetical protein
LTFVAFKLRPVKHGKKINKRENNRAYLERLQKPRDVKYERNILKQLDFGLHTVEGD